MTEILHPFLTKFRQILRGILDQYFLEKECFRSSFYSPGKSGIARPPHGMKLGNTFSGQECSPRLINKYEEFGNIMIDKGKFIVLTFHVIRSSYSSYSSPVNFLEIQRKFPWYSFSNVAIATQHAKTFDRGVPPSLPRFTRFELYTVNSVL